MKPEFLYGKYMFIVWKWLKMFYSKYCPSLAIHFSHLSGNWWMSRQKNCRSFEANQSSSHFRTFWVHSKHCDLPRACSFDAILQQFSSNGNRKSMLSANRSFQAQNSTCSTLLQTMLLYKSCIVLSRKCLWDVNKGFWHQWRSLVITTLSARAIYRQIPVSYLQTW